MSDRVTAFDYAAQCGLLLGAFHRASPAQFDDVVLSGTDPPTSFDTGINETFPSVLLNTSLSGSGGDEAINKVYMLRMASVPAVETPAQGRESSSINGEALYLRLRTAPRSMTLDINLPKLELTDATYSQQWDDLKNITYRQTYGWFLCKAFAFKGFIQNLPDLFWGEKHREVENCTLKIKYFYTATVSGTTKTYTRLR